MATRAEWAKRVERWQKSRLDAEAFAAREGIRPKSLVWWRWKLRSTAPPASPPRAPAPAFLPVRVVEPASSTPRTATAAQIEIALPNGRVVRVPPGFEPAALERVLAIASEDKSC